MGRRLFVPLIAMPVLVLTLVAPTLAAPPLKESGTSKYFNSYSETCTDGRQSTCTYTSLDVFSISPDTALVCLYTATYSAGPGRQQVSQESGRTEQGSDALSVSGDFTVTLASTDIPLYEYRCNRRTCTETLSRTVSVSAVDSATGPVTSSSGRGTFTDGSCTYRYSFTDRSAEVAGTMTIDGVTLDEWGYASVSQYTTTVRCR